VFLQLRPDFGGAPDPSILAGDGPRKVEGEVGGAAGIGPSLLGWEGSTSGVGGASRAHGWG
jgi:hypothetical protein